MATSRPSLTIFAQNKIGGVQFYYSSLLRAGAFNEFDARYILTDGSMDRDPDTKLPQSLEGAPSKLFPLGAPGNCYHAFRNLARELPAQPGVVLANLELELCCLDVHRRPDLTVAHVCHDEYYAGIALEHAHIIDLFIAHNPWFAKRLKAELPADRAQDVYFLPFGIRQSRLRRAQNLDRPLRIVYIGRLHRFKGILDLPTIDECARKLGVKVEWSILGTGPEQGNLERAIAGRGNFTITSPPDEAAMAGLAAKGDVFLLPSRLDGTPLALMEAMSVGLVPVISEFNPGAHWMAPPDTGFVCPLEPAAFASVLARLDANRSELETRSESALAHARRELDIEKRVRPYAELFARWRELKRSPSAPPKHYGTRFLDQPWMPNQLATAVRRVQSWARARRDKEPAQG